MLTVFQKAEGLIILTYQALAVSVLEDGQPRVSHLDAMERVFKAIIPIHPKRLSVITVLCRFAGVPKISEEFRKRAAELGKLTRDQTLGSAMIYEGTGLQATVVRGMISMSQVMNRLPHPVETFASDQEAFVWIGSLPNQLPVIRDAVPTLISELRRYTTKAKVG
ncbi:MAG TPA: hypothetical protein VFH51_17915 [Myxococcota bacterium]|nr:hypothetical protein [Myxococcota bacterium]